MLRFERSAREEAARQGSGFSEERRFQDADRWGQIHIVKNVSTHRGQRERVATLNLFVESGRPTAPTV
jgi:hypothetical protein